MGLEKEKIRKIMSWCPEFYEEEFPDHPLEASTPHSADPPGSQRPQPRPQPRFRANQYVPVKPACFPRPVRSNQQVPTDPEMSLKLKTSAEGVMKHVASIRTKRFHNLAMDCEMVNKFAVEHPNMCCYLRKGTHVMTPCRKQVGDGKMFCSNHRRYARCNPIYAYLLEAEAEAERILSAEAYTWEAQQEAQNALDEAAVAGARAGHAETRARVDEAERAGEGVEDQPDDMQ